MLICQNAIAGTFSLLKTDEDTWELGKMAVTKFSGERHRQCFNAGVDSLNDIKRLVLFFNTILGAANHLYKKYGFKKVIMDIS